MIIGLVVGLVIGFALGSVSLALVVYSREGERNVGDDWIDLDVGSSRPLPFESSFRSERLD